MAAKTAGAQPLVHLLRRIEKSRKQGVRIRVAIMAGVVWFGLTALLFLVNLFHVAVFGGMGVLWLVAVVVVTSRIARSAPPLGLAKEADDRLGLKDSLSSAVDFMEGRQDDWMARETVQRGAALAEKVDPRKIFRLEVPKKLGLVCVLLLVLNLAVFGLRSVGGESGIFGIGGKDKEEEQADPEEELDGSSDKEKGREKGKKKEKAIKRIKIKPLDDKKDASKEKVAQEKKMSPEIAKLLSDPKALDELIQTAKKKDKHKRMDVDKEFGETKVTKINSDVTKDMELKKTDTKSQSDAPTINLDSATIEQMLKAIKEQKEEHKEKGDTLQVQVGIQAQAPPGSKTTTGSPGGGGEGGGDDASKTEDTRVKPRRIRVDYEDFRIISGGRGANPNAEKGKSNEGALGDIGMLLSRKAVEVTQKYADGGFGEPPKVNLEEAQTDRIPFGMKNAIQRYFELIAPKDTR